MMTGQKPGQHGYRKAVQEAELGQETWVLIPGAGRGSSNLPRPSLFPNQLRQPFPWEGVLDILSAPSAQDSFLQRDFLTWPETSTASVLFPSHLFPLRGGLFQFPP